MDQPASAYFMEDRHDPIEAHTLSVLVQNEPGVLARVIGLFSGRGYNIESLTVSETENQKHVSRITIVTTGTPMVIEQIKHQLDRMVPVYRVVDMTLAGRSIERELAMVKLRGTGEHRVEALRLAEAFRARVIDATIESFVFEITGNSAKINQFIDLMRPLGLVEVSRTGVAAISRGAGEHRVETLRLADAFRARVIDATIESFVFEITGNSAKITQFIDLMRPLGLVEVARTGVAAIGRGAEGM